MGGTVNVASIQVLAGSFAIMPNAGDPSNSLLALPPAGGSIDVESGAADIGLNLSCPGDFQKLGPGPLNLAGDNMLGGDVDIQNGVVAIGNDDAMGNAPIKLSPNATLQLNGYDLVTAAISGAGGTITDGGATGFSCITTTQTDGTSFAGEMVSTNLQLPDVALIQQTPGSVMMPGDATAVALTVDTSPATYGDLASFTASVTDTTDASVIPTGTMALFNGTTYLGSQVLDGSSNSVTFTAISLPGGTNSLQAVYLGNDSLATSTSPPLSLTLGQVATTTSLSISTLGGSTVYGQPVTLTATVSSTGDGTPSGTVEFWNGATDLGPGYLDSDGNASLTVSGLAVGDPDQVTAEYEGDANFASSTSSWVDQVVGQAATATSLAATSANLPPVAGQEITFTATVTVVGPGGGTPTGSVQFYDDSTPLGSASVDAGGNASLTVCLGAGNYGDVTAVYQGDSNYAGSSSTAPAEAVVQDSTATSVTSSVDPAVPGQPIDFTATVAAASPGSGVPTGSVEFCVDGNCVDTVELDASGVATLSVPGTTAGDYGEVTAAYLGDTNFLGSMSPAFDQTVNQGETVTSLTSSADPAVLGHEVIFTASVAVADPASGTPTGTVEFYNNNGLNDLGQGTFRRRRQLDP